MKKPTSADTRRELTLEDRRRFLKLPMEERRRQMEQQAARVVRLYTSKRAVKERESLGM
jgi:hypothetical protein